MPVKDKKISKLETIEAMALDLARISREARELMEGEGSRSPKSQDADTIRALANRRKNLIPKHVRNGNH
jgi:hypothetical protein